MKFGARGLGASRVVGCEEEAWGPPYEAPQGLRGRPPKQQGHRSRCWLGAASPSERGSSGGPRRLESPATTGLSSLDAATKQGRLVFLRIP